MKQEQPRVNHRVEVRRTHHRIKPDPARVLTRPFIPGDAQRVRDVVERVLGLPDDLAERQWEKIERTFQGRHEHMQLVLERQCQQIAAIVSLPEGLSDVRRRLLGSYFTSEFALESAALFNPSIVPHPDQSNLPEGALRFVMSLRATGEGHLSSIEFRSGTIDPASEVQLDPVGRYVETPELIEETDHDRELMKQKISELGQASPLSDEVLARSSHRFTMDELGRLVREREARRGGLHAGDIQAVNVMTWVAQSRHELVFQPGEPLCERVIFPASADESRGIEDARFVRFAEEDGTSTYYATYSAYNGQVVLPQLLETTDFVRFKVSALYGGASQNKGMALFPRRIDGRYAAISRLDGENLHLTTSDNIYIWEEARPLLKPLQPWEFVQMGNCGSPIETEAGWLLLTHGVGAMRRYCIGAVLLDRNDPSKVISRLREPLLEPHANEREGYVPNVVYSCGALLHRGVLVLPYAMADYASNIALVDVAELLAHLV